MKTLTLAVLALLFNLAEAKHQHHAHHLVQLQKESEELCDGDAKDDQEIENETDPNDKVVDDYGFARNWVQIKADVRKESDEIADGDSADDRELEDENDPEDPIVQDHGFRAGIYNYNMANYVQLADRPIDNQHLLYEVTKYSDTIANGDESDDKELHEEEDPKDPVVDINGSGKARYGHAVPTDFFAGNHIFPDHFGTVPRDESPNQN